MNNFFKALYRKKVSGNAKRIIIAYKKTIIFYWLYERKNKVFFIISTILRSYLHYFILLEFSNKRHDVIQYMYHLNTLDLFHLFENISTNIFFSLSVILMTDLYTDFYHTYNISVILHTWATNRLEDTNCMYMCGHSDKRLDIESEYIQYVRYESSFKISHICTKRREVFHRPQKIESLFIYKI